MTGSLANALGQRAASHAAYRDRWWQQEKMNYPDQNVLNFKKSKSRIINIARSR